MTLNNAVRLSFLNIDKAWKLVLYRIVVWAIIIGLMSPCFFMLSSAFNELMTAEATKSFVSSGVFYSGTITEVSKAFMAELSIFFDILANKYVGLLIYYAVLLFILLPTLMNMGKYTVNAMMYGYMSSHSKNSFCTTYISSFGKAFMFGLFRSLFNLVFNLSIFAIFYGLVMVEAEGFDYVMPYIFIIATALVLAIKQVLVMGWAPSMIVCDENSVKGFGFGIKTTFRRFGISFASSFVLYLVSFALFLGFGVYSLIVIVPAFAIISSVAEMIVFFGNHGMKYYIDGDTIISPKKHEELDKINQIKFLL